MIGDVREDSEGKLMAHLKWPVGGRVPRLRRPLPIHLFRLQCKAHAPRSGDVVGYVTMEEVDWH